MRTWNRARSDGHCGSCRAPIAVGSPVLLIRFGGDTGRALVRCVACEGPAPPDLPTLVELKVIPIPIPMTRFAAGMLPLDFKSRQMAREPGEDDA